VLDLRADGLPRLKFADKEGKPHAGVTMLQDGWTGISLIDRSGKEVWRAP